MTISTLCIECGCPKSAHALNVTKLGKSEEVRPFFSKALSECSGFDPDDPDAEMQMEQRDAIREEEYLDEMRPHSRLDSHWD